MLPHGAEAKLQASL